MGSVLDKLVLLLSHEANLLTGLHSEVHSIKRELESIKCFLKEADSKAEAEGETLQKWCSSMGAASKGSGVSNRSTTPLPSPRRLHWFSQ